jgi:hypothetical protein
MAAAGREGAAGDGALPARFRDLEPWLDWALATERERKARRIASSMEEIKAFYAAVSARLEAIILELDETPYPELTPPQRRLADMCLALVEVCNLVELYKGPDVMDAMEPARFVPHE